jgi:xanthine dehydrogenase YagR molybdenum-binding subunit
MRAPGECSGSAALESAMDELSVQLAMDPIELRLKNYADADQNAGKPYSSKSLKECYEKGAAQFGWKRRKPQPRAQSEGDEWVGYGMATATYPANRFAAQASVVLSANGKVKVRCATQDIGTGSWTIFTQLAADCLGVSADQVDLDIGDSKFPKGSVSGGSSTASSVGSAIQRACMKIKAELAQGAIKSVDSPLYQSAVEDLAFHGGRLESTRDPKKGVATSELFKIAKKDQLEAEGEMKMERSETEGYSTHAFGAQFAEVRVHALTGQVRVTKMTGAFACGRILNSKTAESQFMGGMIFAIGQALMEESLLDLRSGRLAIKDLADYHVPVNADVPKMDIIMVEEDDPHVNPIGTKGIGEIGVVGVAAAIANAVFNATGVRIRDFPLTPDKVMAGLGPLV